MTPLQKLLNNTWWMMFDGRRQRDMSFYILKMFKFDVHRYYDNVYGYVVLVGGKPSDYERAKQIVSKYDNE